MTGQSAGSYPFPSRWAGSFACRALGEVAYQGKRIPAGRLPGRKLQAVDDARVVITRLQRIWALTAAGAIIATVATSNIPPNLALITGNVALGFAVAYVVSLIWVAVNPFEVAAHGAAAVFGALYWLGRGGGFLELVMNGGGDSPDDHTNVLWFTVHRVDLLGAVAERWSRAVAVVMWHSLLWAMVTLVRRHEDAHELG